MRSVFAACWVHASGAYETQITVGGYCTAQPKTVLASTVKTGTAKYFYVGVTLDWADATSTPVLAAQ